MQDAATPTTPKVAWQRFIDRGGDFYAELERLTGRVGPADAMRGGLAAEIVERVERQELDESLLVGTLRTYQHFGARFALSQQRVMLGDEMGLGKTFQAIAVLAHLAARGQTHFLVICPASVVIGWQREIGQRSKLRSHRLHGDQRERGLDDWLRQGGVAITTFETLRVLEVPVDVPAAVVVDEAHYLKNPDAKRTQAAATVLAVCPRALLLTGTPLENRVEEFTNLVGLVRDDLVGTLDLAAMRLGPDAFRREVAPVYLRRNQADVLMELPERIETDEWVELGRTELAAYRAAVLEGNWMAMRQAAFASPASEKLDRLVDLCAEAAANQRKVVVFSYFLGTLDMVRQALGPRSLGPLTGSLSPDRRQQLVDEFTAGPADRVLLAQVQAGGVGLNVQTASVVLLCEPQLKPSTEDQAIARIGWARSDRWTCTGSAPRASIPAERISRLLETKQKVFDDFAARSEVAEASGSATDPGLAGVAKQLIAVEQARLGTGPAD